MDLFEEIRKREEDKRQRQEAKVQKLRQKLNKADNQFFEDDIDGGGEVLKRRELLNFQPQELQTVFVQPAEEEEEETTSSQTGCLCIFTNKLFRQQKKPTFFSLFLILP